MSTEEISQLTAAMEKVDLHSSDGVVLEVEVKVASLSTTLKNMIDDCGCEHTVPVPNVAGNILSMVIEYCKKHAEADPEEDLKEWDAEFMRVELSTLFDLVTAANYLDIKGLLDLTCQSVADLIRGKSPEEIRQFFGIKNDFTPEEEEEIRKENLWAWAFE